MEWRKIKTVIIIFLLAVNIFLIYELSVQYKSTRMFSDDTLEEIEELLRAENIEVKDGAVPSEIFSLGVYEVKYENYYSEAFERMAGTSDYMPISDADGVVRIINHEDESVYEFSENFGFSFYADGYAAYSPENITGGISGISKSKIKELTKKISLFLFGSKPNNALSGFEIEIMGASTDEERILLHCVQKISSVIMNGFEFDVMVYKNRICCIKGDILLAYPNAEYNGNQYDQINILMLEKKYINAERKNDTEKMYTIDCMDMEYTVSWNNDATKIYLIPSWKICYEDGTVRMRNSVTGTLYG